jgi:tetratricopeptide (TPR) repeat protein
MQRLFLSLAAVSMVCSFAQAQNAGNENYRKGLELNNAGKYREAIPYLTKAVETDGKNSDAFTERGRAWNELSEYDKAIADFNQALAINPKSAIAYNNRGNAWNHKGEHDKAIADLDQSLRLNPKSAIAYNNRGNARNRKGEYEKAIADYAQALAVDPKYVAAYNDLAWLQATCVDQRYRNAKKAFENASKAYEISNGTTWFCVGTLAAVYAESNDFDKAKEWQAKAIDMTPDEKNKLDGRSRLEL